jgi:SRSO17 transposase
MDTQKNIYINTLNENTGSGPESPQTGPMAGVIELLAENFHQFIESFKGYFKTVTSSVFVQAEQYLNGLMIARKRNMERMAEVVPNSDDQVLQQFLSKSPWDEGAVIDRVAWEVDQLFGEDPNTCLIVDESGFPKKGNKSAGVERQWCGEKGKVDNCQVGVFLSLSCGQRASLINDRLYLPQEWVNNPERCREAGIPEEHIIFKSKSELAIEMVKHADANAIRFNWVGADGGYGKEPKFLRDLNSAGHIFVVDVHKDQTIYLENPKPMVPERESNKGRNPTKLKAQTDPIRVDKWVAQQPESSWERVIIRKTTKGELIVDILHVRIWLWDGEEEHAHCWHLIVRREVDSPEEIKYTLSNAPEETTPQRLAFMQGQRYWIERSLQDGKNACGLGDYQVRLWRGWHHHVALVMMAMLFMLKNRICYKSEHPLLSCLDIQVLLARFLPRRDVTVEEILRQMRERHRRRQASIDSSYRKQQKALSSRGS